MIVGTTVRVNSPEHYTHGQIGEVRYYNPETGWGRVALDDARVGEMRAYRDEHVEEVVKMLAVSKN